MRTIKILLALLFIAEVSFSQTQEDKIKSMRMDAEYYFFNGNYEEALKRYKEVLQLVPDNCNVNYKIGLVRSGRCRGYRGGRTWS